MSFTLPESVWDEDIAVVAKKGGGKSYTIKGAAEAWLDAGRQVAVIDPLGHWWGLRTAADGKGAGFPITIFGGEHADIPITDKSGDALARILVERRLSCVIDLGMMRKGEQCRFVRAFLDTLFAVNRQAMHLILEEADLFAPQNPMGENALTLEAVDRIVRRGRAFGFRVTTLTQRPARLHKDVLTQIGTLIAMRTVSPHDRAAVKSWIDANATTEESRGVMNSLATLKVGEGWLWSPEQGLLERVAFPRIRTLDTSATPRHGARARKLEKVAPVELEAIAEALAPPADKADEKSAPASEPARAELEAAERRGFDMGYRKGLDVGRKGAGYDLRAPLISLRGRLEALAESVDALERAVFGDETGPENSREEMAPRLSGGDCSPKRVAPAANGSLSPGAAKLLATFVAYHPRRFTLRQAAKLTGQSVRSSLFRPNTKELIEGGWIEEDPAGRWQASRAACAVHGKNSLAPAAPEDVLRQWKEKLPPAPGRMLDVLREAGGRWRDRTTIAERAGVSLKSSTLGAGLKELVDAGLAVKDGPSYRLHEDFRS